MEERTTIKMPVLAATSIDLNQVMSPLPELIFLWVGIDFLPSVFRLWVFSCF